LSKLREAAGDARFHRADGHFENRGDFLVGTVVKIEQRDRGLIDFVDSCECRPDLRGIESIEFQRDGGQIVRRFRQLAMGMPGLSAPRDEESAVERREQPGLDLRAVLQLMTFGGPDVKRLLGQILRVGFIAREAQRKPVESFVVFVHDRFKWFG
jgi:hypothetical protein